MIVNLETKTNTKIVPVDFVWKIDNIHNVKSGYKSPDLKIENKKVYFKIEKNNTSRYEIWIYNKSWPSNITIRKGITGRITETFRRKHRLFPFYHNIVGNNGEVRINISFELILKIVTNTIVYRTHRAGSPRSLIKKTN